MKEDWAAFEVTIRASSHYIKSVFCVPVSKAKRSLFYPDGNSLRVYVMVRRDGKLVRDADDEIKQNDQVIVELEPFYHPHHDIAMRMFREYLQFFAAPYPEGFDPCSKLSTSPTSRSSACSSSP